MHAIVYHNNDDDSQSGHVLAEGESFSTQEGATLLMPDGSHVELAEETRIVLEGLKTIRLHLEQGSLRTQVEPLGHGMTYEVSTPTTIAGVRGTDFSISYEGGEETHVDVFEGSVKVAHGEEEHHIAEGKGFSGSHKASRLRAIREGMHEQWQHRRDRMMAKLVERFAGKSRDEIREIILNDPRLREQLKKLPAKAREKLFKHLKRHLQDANAERFHQEAKKQKAKRRPFQTQRQQKAEERRQKVQEKRLQRGQ